MLHVKDGMYIKTKQKNKLKYNEAVVPQTHAHTDFRCSFELFVHQPDLTLLFQSKVGLLRCTMYSHTGHRDTGDLGLLRRMRCLLPPCGVAVRC